jgi:hypothetical protein
MSDSAPALRREPEPLAESDYDSILDAVMETARGRWFLREFAQRNRHADTGMLLTAIGRIESLLTSREDSPEPEPIPAPPRVAEAPADTAAVLRHLRDIAENLIECGAPIYLCNDLLRRIEELAAACAQPVQEQLMPAQTPPQPQPQPQPQPNVPTAGRKPAEPVRDPFADILALSPEERIALFT